MTLKAYSPEMLDQLALRMLDMAATVREIARRCRENDLPGVPLHDRKVLQWCDGLEQWCHRTRAGAEVEIQEARASRRARQIR